MLNGSIGNSKLKKERSFRKPIKLDRWGHKSQEQTRCPITMYWLCTVWGAEQGTKATVLENHPQKPTENFQPLWFSHDDKEIISIPWIWSSGSQPEHSQKPQLLIPRMGLQIKTAVTAKKKKGGVKNCRHLEDWIYTTHQNAYVQSKMWALRMLVFSKLDKSHVVDAPWNAT